MSDHEIALRYGCNPHQSPARARAIAPEAPLPFRVLNGSPGYINLLDALNSWSLVRDLGLVTGQAAAASFKHVSPAGAAVGTELDATDRRAFFVPEDEELSPLACAYARARGADRVSSFGDWIALSQPVDVPTAKLIRREVSDGVVAPGFEEGAFELLAGKKGGKYPVIEMDAEHRAAGIEARDVGGVRLEQPSNTWTPDDEFPGEIVSRRTDLDDATRRDLVVATVALKYVQSNSVVLAKDGQVIGAGAGQQSRIHCTRLACDKADGWWLRRHPRLLELPFVDGLKRPARDNAIDQFLLDQQAEPLERLWRESFFDAPTRLTGDEKRAWIAELGGVALSSDAFFPFRDSIDRAGASGVAAIVHPGGSIRDEEVTGAADEYAMLLAHSGTRLFTH